MSYLGAVRSSSPTVATGNLAAADAAVTVDCAGFTTAMVVMVIDGTYDSSNFEEIAFEVTLDGVTWVRTMWFWNEQGTVWNTGTSEAAQLGAMVTPVFVLLHGATGFRVRMLAAPAAGGIDTTVALSMVAAIPPPSSMDIYPGQGARFRIRNDSGGDAAIVVTASPNLPVTGPGLAIERDSNALAADDDVVSAVLSNPSFQVVGSFTGDLICEVSIDYTNWVAVDLGLLTDVSTGAAPAAVSEGVFVVEMTGPIGVRVRAANTFSGPSTVTLQGVQT